MAAVMEPEELMQEGGLSFDKGDFEAGVRSYRQAANLYIEQGNFQLRAFALAALALRLSSNPSRFEEAFKAYEDATEAFRKAGQPRQAVDALFSAGVLSKDSGRSTLASKLLTEVAQEYELLSSAVSDTSETDSASGLKTLAAEARRQVGEIKLSFAAQSEHSQTK